MAEYSHHKFKLKSGKEVIIRSATRQDAAEILELSTSVIAEEIYQLTSSSEFKMTIEAEEKWIESHLANPDHLVIVAEIDSKIVGLLDFSNGHRQRIAHTGEFGMSVHKDFRSLGIGSLLIGSLIGWAKAHPKIEKINLCVHQTNERAIAVYKKHGFQVEGLRTKDLKYPNGAYVDTVLMGLQL